MRQTTIAAVLGIFLLTGLAAHKTRGQTAGTAQMTKAQVMQGDTVQADVLLDKAPSLEGSLQITALPDGETSGGVVLNCGMGAGQTKAQPRTTIPLDAKIGRWMITKIVFAPASGGTKVLSMHGDSSFEVVAHGEITLPDSVTISEIK